MALAAVASSRAAVVHVPAEQPTIQAAVNAASAGDEVQIAPGVYTEQVIIENKDLTLTGAVGTVLRGWSKMKLSPKYGWFNLVEITRANVVVRNLEFEGEWLVDALAATPNYGYSAISYDASGGTVDHCSIHGFRGGTTLGFVSGVGVVTWNPISLGGARVHVEIVGNAFADNALSIWMTGDWMSNPSELRTTFNIENNSISGIGPTSLGTQHGIVIV